MQTIVIGHRNPDMDSICSAIAYARLKTFQGVENVIAARAGSTNERIDYVLNHFGVEAPVFISDLSPRVQDVMERGVISIRPESSVYEAVRLIEQYRLRGLPVVDAQGHCLGLLSLFKVLRQLFPKQEASGTTRMLTASLAEIVGTFGGTALVGEATAEVGEYLLMVGAMGHESFRDRLKRYDPRQVVLIVGDRVKVVLAAIESGVRAVVITGGLELSGELHAMAKRNGVALFSSPVDTATTVIMARGAINVERKLEGEYLSFSPDTLLETARDEAAASGQFIFPVLDGGRLVGILSKSDFLKPIPRQLILVDHNELSQAVAGAEKVPIIEVLDHHRLGGFLSDTPILFWNNPVGSTSSIVAMCYRQAGVEIPKDIAGLLMAGLISDTLNLTSPTATAADAEILKHLAEITGCNPAELAAAIFSVGSPLLTMTPQQAINADCKEYSHNGARFTVAQIEELSFSHFHEREAVLIAALEEHCRAGRYLFSALLVTDVNTQVSILLLSGARSFMRRIDYPVIAPNQWELEGVVSRKKQLLPYLLGRLQGMSPAEEAEA